MSDTDHILKAATDRLASIEAERSELLTFIATYKRLSASIRAPMTLGSTPREPLSELPRPQPIAARTWSTDEIINRALEVIGANRRPTKLGEIFEALIAQGVEIGGAIPRNNLGAKLSAAKAVLRTIPGEGWWFANEPWPPTGDEERVLDNFEAEYAKGPADYAGPSQLNGAAGHHPASTWGE